MTIVNRSAVLAIVLGLAITAPAVAAQAPAPAKQDIIAEVRGLIAKSDFTTAEQTLRAYAKDKGWTPEALEAMAASVSPDEMALSEAAMARVSERLEKLL